MTEYETERQATANEAAAELRRLADELEEGTLALDTDGPTVTLEPVEPITLKREAESDWSEGDTEAKQSVELELVWRRPATTAEEAALGER